MNTRERYANPKTIADNGPTWAKGCEHCSYGVKEAMPLTHAAEIVLERIVQFEDGLIEFCDCQAGKAYHAYIFNRRQTLIEEARKDPRMNQQAQRGTHVDIQNARYAIYARQPEPTFAGAEPA